MTGEAVWIDGTELILETSASSASVADDAYREMDSDDRQPADDPGYQFGRFEVDTETTGFSAAPTAGARIDIHEQIINSDGSDGPAPDANYTAGFIGSIAIDPADVQQFLESKPLALNKTGGKYWIHYVDGGAGTASMDAGWECRMIPTTLGPAA